MAKNIPDVNVLTDTFNTWALRTNDIIGVLGTEVLTANSTQGVTGTAGSQRNARLFGTFTANTLVADRVTVASSLVANATALSIAPSILVIANSSPGTAGQVLTSSSTGVYWSTIAAGGGGISTLTAGNGILFNTGPTITSTGTMNVKAADGSITVNSSGVSVNTAFLSGGLTNASTLQNRTWESPGTIGSATANTGSFTTVTATAAGGYRIAGDAAFVINNTLIQTPGRVDATTPNDVSAGGVRIRGNATFGYLQFTNSLGSTTPEWSHLRVNSAGRAFYSRALEVEQNFQFNGTGTHGGGLHAGVEIGYKIVPQIVSNANTTLTLADSSGAHHYKTTSNEIELTIPNAASAIGTAITFVNDAGSGNLKILQGSGIVLQVAGTTVAAPTGIVTVGPGGLATALRVSATKWIVSGVGVS